tara:strand:- start:3047 stop:4024 length:978 start_codon:yes stop_codon:yes gene_type:complete
MTDRFFVSRLNSLISLSGIVIFLKGMAMGLGDSVPGVSGGTIAVITNIYERLIFALGSIDSNAVRLLGRGKIAKFWGYIDGNFLSLLLLGILAGLLVSANTVLFLLENFPEPLMAFFIGLVLSSARILQSKYSLEKMSVWVLLFLGVFAAVCIGNLEPRGIADNSYFYIFLCGAIGICAMILPGISGAFILLLLGAYQFMLNALVTGNLPYISVFIMGCVLGLLVFSRILGWLLRNYHDYSFGFISGVLVGSAYFLWPWQHAVSFYVDSSGIQQPLQTNHILPLNYTEMTGNSPWLGLAILAFFVGIILVNILNIMFDQKNVAEN